MMSENSIIRILNQLYRKSCDVTEMQTLNVIATKRLGTLIKETLNLINCKNAKIEALRMEKKQLDKASIRAEAVNEFAEIFLEKIHTYEYLVVDRINSKDYGMFTVGIEEAVNETKEEMVGEDKTPSAENNFLYNRFMKKE